RRELTGKAGRFQVASRIESENARPMRAGGRSHRIAPTTSRAPHGFPRLPRRERGLGGARPYPPRWPSCFALGTPVAKRARVRSASAGGKAPVATKVATFAPTAGERAKP